MSRFCSISSKGPLFGCNVSHANNKTPRTFLPNVHKVKVYSHSLNCFIAMKVSSSGLRTLDKHGGIDRFLQKTSSRSLPPFLLKFKKKILKKKPLHKES